MGHTELERLDYQTEVLRAARDLERFLVGDAVFFDQLHECLVEGLHPIVLALGDGLLDLAGLIRVQ